MSDISPQLSVLAARQHGVSTRLQLESIGLSRGVVSSQIRAGRWATWGCHVVFMHNHQPTRRQLMWASVLDAGWPAALASHTSLELAGFRSMASEAEQLHLIVPKGAKVTRDDQIIVHESRRVREEFHVFHEGLPHTPAARSAIDAAAWQPWPTFACTLVAAVVQQRICTVDDLDFTLRYVGRVRHKQHLRATLGDLRGGSQSLGEIDLVRMCDRHGLVRPTRQVRRRDRDGRFRYLDAMWTLDGGRAVVLEIDGRHHVEIGQWQDDVRRERAIVLDGARVLRATAMEVRTQPQSLIADLRAIGVPSCPK